MRELLREDLHHVVASMPKDLIALIKKYPSLMIAGGFIRSVIAGERISDIDIFGPSVEVLKQAAQEIAISRKGRIHETANAITVLAPPRIPVQFITRWLYTNDQDLIKAFDFTIAQAVILYLKPRKPDDTPASEWFEPPGEWKGFCSDRFYEDLAARRLYYTSPVREKEPGGSLLRVRKFLMKGYTIQAWSLGMVIARLIGKIEPEKLGHADIGQVIVGLLREVDPLRIVDGIEMHEDVEIEHGAN